MLYRFLRFFCFAAAGALLASAAPLAAEIIFYDDFLDQASDMNPGTPWTGVIVGGGSITVRQDVDDVFGEGPANQYLEWMRETTSGPMALRANLSGAADVASITFSFIQPADFPYFGQSNIILQAGGGTTSADRANVIRLGTSTNHIGNSAEYQIGVVQHVELIVNNRDENIVYGEGQLLEAGRVDIWINGALAQEDYVWQNNRKGPLTRFEFNLGGSDQQKLLINEVTIESIAFETEIIPPGIVFEDDFLGHSAETSPGSPWTSVIDGIGIGQIRVKEDAENIFGKESGNQYLSYNKNATASSGALRAFGVMSAPVATFSLRFVEPSTPEYADESFVIVHAGPSSPSTNRAQVIQFGNGGIGRTATYEKGIVNQLDLVINNSEEPVIYAGDVTVAPGTADIWINGNLAETGFTRQNYRRGPIEGFELNTSGSSRLLYLIDEFVVRDFAYVTGQGSEDPFSLWQAEHFSAEELEDPEISGPLADPAGDGVANLLAYALHLDPWIPASRDALPIPEITDTGLTLTFNRSKQATDLEYIVEVSSDLMTWDFGGEFVEEIFVADNGETETVVYLDRLSGEGDAARRFIRLRVEQ